MRERYHVPVGVVSDVVGIRVVLQWEDKGKDEVEHVEDGQGGEVPVGTAAHSSPRHDDHGDRVADDAYYHYHGHKDSLYPKADCITVEV